MHKILLIHGIRTEGLWHDIAQPILEGASNTKVVPISYGYFDVFRFLLPGFLRKAPQKRILVELEKIANEITSDTQDQKISVIAHSFGTYSIISLLEQDIEVELDYLILCNSVVKSTFDFNKIAPKIKSGIINEVGYRDIWPVLAKILTVGYGNSGTYGFGSASCTDRFHDIDHGSFFNFHCIHKYWLSIFRDDHVIDSDFNRNSKKRSLLIHTLSLFPPCSLTGLILLLSCFLIFVL